MIFVWIWNWRWCFVETVELKAQVLGLVPEAPYVLGPQASLQEVPLAEVPVRLKGPQELLTIHGDR